MNKKPCGCIILQNKRFLNMLYSAKRKNKIMPFMGASGVKNHVKWKLIRLKKKDVVFSQTVEI